MDNSQRPTKKISIAYSPDTDDQFMVLALRERRVDWEDFEFEFVVDDIQRLNDAAIIGTYDVSAISVGAYPHLRTQYMLMPIGASIGDAFGPAVVTNPNSQLTLADLQGKRIAVPGINTSAHMAAQTLFGPFIPVPTYFMNIRDAVSAGEVDAGILIHELQLNPESQGLRKIADLGQLWFERFHLPLPLGANAIKRSLGNRDIARITRIYRSSIEVGLSTRDASINGAMATAAARNSLNQQLGDRYISMYVNERSLDFQEDTLAGIDQLYAAGSSQGLFQKFDLKSHISS